MKVIFYNITYFLCFYHLNDKLFHGKICPEVANMEKQCLILDFTILYQNVYAL